MKKATKKNTKKNAQTELVFEQVARFAAGDKVEISTDKGWVDGVVECVHHVDAMYGLPAHIHYDVRYIPLWARNEKYGYKEGRTVCMGPAIRALQEGEQ